MSNPVGGNGGGSYTNEYTFLFDIFSPSGSRISWRSLFQTNTSNSNDVDYFIRNSDDKIGISTPLGYSTNPISDSVWIRLVLVFDVNASGTASTVRAYVNGSLFHTHNFTGGRDGTYGLEGNVLMFGDNNSENAALHVGTLAFWGQALNATQVAALGAAGATVINQAPVITEGATFALPNARLNGTDVNGTLNVTDTENDSITWSVSTAANGTGAMISSSNSQATISYIPAANFTGADSWLRADGVKALLEFQRMSRSHFPGIQWAIKAGAS